MNDAGTLERIRQALIVDAFSGIRRTADTYAFGAFQLAGALLDTVSCLAEQTGHRKARFAAFFSRYFPAAYAADNLPARLYEGLRNLPLHNYSTSGLLLMDGQAESLHLQVRDGCTVLRLQNLLDDLESALRLWWADVQADPVRRARVLAEQRLRPVVSVEAVEVGLTWPISLPAEFPQGASAYGAFAFGAVMSQPPRRFGG